MDQDSGDKIHVTLIHGTFARGAPWTKEGSKLRKHLQKALDDRVQFHDEFVWSGLPSHLARHLAARDLKAFMHDLLGRFPGRHFLIGHSYGGMVAAYALRDPDLGEKVEGLITLSTPFLVSRPRQLSVLGRIAALVCGMSIYGILAKLTWPVMEGTKSVPPAWYIPLLALLAIFGVFAAIGPGLAKLTAWFLGTLAIPKMHPDRVFIIRGPSDEAGALMTIFHGFELLITAVWGRRGPFDRFLTERVASVREAIRPRVTRTVKKALFVWMILTAVVGLFWFVALGVLTFRYGEDVYPTVIFSSSENSLLTLNQNLLAHLRGDFFWPALVAGILGLPGLLALALMIFAMVFAVTLAFPVGAIFLICIICVAVLALTTVPELGPCAATIVVSAEAAPPGASIVLQLNDDLAGDSFLLHSLSYTSPVSLAAISNWLARTKPVGEPLVERQDRELSCRLSKRGRDPETRRSGRRS